MSEMKQQQKKPFHETVAEKIIEQLKAGTAPWQKPWDDSAAISTMPMNPTTGKRYKGINAIYLMCQGYSDSRWMTYKQAASIGAQVNKGEKSTSIQYWQFYEEVAKRDEKGALVKDKDGNTVKVKYELERPKVFFSSVFNAEQISGLPPLDAKAKKYEWNSNDRAETILKNSGAAIEHKPTDKACYRPRTDTITLPERSMFESADKYYATALHELGHWTGHATRLARDIENPFGSEQYAREELRAEIASMMVGNETGVGHDPGQHAAYVGSWIKALENDHLEIFRAASDAEKIFSYVMDFEQKQEIKLGVELTDDQLIDSMYSREMFASMRESMGEEMLLEKIATGLLAEDARAEYKMELFTLENIQNGTLESKVHGMDSIAIENIKDILGKMIPLNTENTFWQRCVLPHDVDALEAKIVRADEFLEAALDLSRAADRAFENEAQIAQDPETSTKDRVEAKNARLSADAAAFGSAAAERLYLSVPYTEKDKAKELGARWDRQEKSWYVPAHISQAPFEKWIAKTEAGPERMSETQSSDKKEYLAVPYGEHKAAKAAGAMWDKEAKAWYIGANADLQRLERWNANHVKSTQDPAMNPREELAEAMKTMGLIVSGDHPIMDGERHRVAVEGDSAGATSGWYVGHMDGHPAGYIKNYRSGLDMTWRSKGYVLDDDERAKLQAEAATKLEERRVSLAATFEASANRLAEQTRTLQPLRQPSPYLAQKGVQVHDGALTDTAGKTTYIPAFDTAGKLWTMQYIQENGTKRFAKDSRKEGCFHPVGGMEGLETAPVLAISEGYATAATVAEIRGHATVAAFDAGNLAAVAQALHEKYPEKPVIIYGDDDRHLPMITGHNPGREKGEEAARLTGGKAVFPVFAPGEAAYPAELPAITPERYREHAAAEKVLAEAAAGDIQLSADKKTALENKLLSAEQLDAIATMKAHTDFNDLTRSQLGRSAVERQVAMKSDSRKEKVERQEKILAPEPDRTRKSRSR